MYEPRQISSSWDTQSFSYVESIKEWFWFPMNFAKFVGTPFLRNISWWLLLLRLKCKLKVWLQSKQICTPLLTNLHIWNSTTAATADNLKFYSKWAVSIYCPPCIKIDCSFVKWVINDLSVRALTWGWVVGKMNYYLFENKKEPYQWVFPKAVFALCLSWLGIYPCKIN